LNDDEGTFSHEIRIDAPADVVFSYFTDPEKMARWMGIDHKLDPVPGGVFMVDINGKFAAAGEYVEVEPPRRVVFTWGWQGDPDMPPGSTTVEANLTPDGDATILHFVHRGLPPSRQATHADGWLHYLGRLEIAGGGNDPGPDLKAGSDE